jgi:hypothetical protein
VQLGWHKKRAESIFDPALHSFSWNALIVEFQGYVQFDGAVTLAD